MMSSPFSSPFRRAGTNGTRWQGQQTSDQTAGQMQSIQRDLGPEPEQSILTDSTLQSGIIDRPPGVQIERIDQRNKAPFSIQDSGEFRELGADGSPLQQLETMPPELSEIPDESVEQDQEEILQYYPDGKIRIRRFVKQDESGNYIKDGPWFYYDRDKRVIAAGRYRDGIMHGQWRRIHSSSEGGLFATKPFNLFSGQFESIANFENGRLDGAWTIIDQYRRKVFEIGYKNGVRHGNAAWFYPNSAKMREANFKDGLLDGQISELDESGREIGVEVFIEGRKLVRNTTFYRPSVRKSEDYYLDKKLIPNGQDDWWNAKPTGYGSEGDRVQDGPSLQWYENGQRKKRGTFKNDLPVGQFTAWHPNGLKQIQGNYDDGLKNGRWTWWHENGMKSFEGIYKDDKPIGVWRAWNVNGQIRKEETFSLDGQSSNSTQENSTDDDQGTSVVEDMTGGDIKNESESEPAIETMEEITPIDFDEEEALDPDQDGVIPSTILDNDKRT